MVLVQSSVSKERCENKLFFLFCFVFFLNVSAFPAREFNQPQCKSFAMFCLIIASVEIAGEYKNYSH